MKMKKFLLFGACLASSVSYAETISKIEFVGCKRVEPETIESYLPIQVGDEYDQDLVNEALKSLNATGFFKEVKIEEKGSTLVVTVQEYPIINKISFEGNSKLSDRDIYNSVKLKSREVLSPAKVKEIQQGLLEAYRKMGRYSATVNPKIINLDNNRVNLVFEISEGTEAKIGRITFIGNDNFSANELRDIIYSKVNRWYRFFVTDDVYDSERLQEDKVALAKFYRENGYAKAKITSAVAELSSDKKEFYLTFVIDEGDVYQIGDVKIKSGIPKLSEKDFDDDFYCKKGKVYNATLLEADTGLIIRQAGLKGFSSVVVDPVTNINAKTKTVDIMFNITEGPKMYISKIIIKGNTRTRDAVIRREIVVEEGDAYNQALVGMSEEKIRGLGFFKYVNISVVPDQNSPDKCIMEVEVEENSTGEIQVSGSYSTGDGFGLDLTYSERNFLGTGKGLNVYLGSGKTRTGRSWYTDSNGNEQKIHRKEKFRFLNNINVSVSDPHLFDKDMEGSLSAFKYTTSKWDSFTTREIGGSFGLSYDLSSHFTQGWEYSFSDRKFDDLSPGASPFIKYQVLKKEGDSIHAQKTEDNTLSSLKHTISYNTRFLTGLKGALNTGLSTTFAGIGGNARHLKNEVFGSYVFPIQRKTHLKLALSAGLLSKVGGENPHMADTFSKGLDSFRGFDDCGVGPVYETTRVLTDINPLTGKITHKNAMYREYAGAKKYWKGTMEYVFPIGLPEELQFRGFVFSDFGTLWNPSYSKKNKYMKTYAVGSTTGQKVVSVYGEDVVLKAFGAKSLNEIKNEQISTFSYDPTVLRHRILDTKKTRVSIGCGISFITPFGPMKFTYAFPVRKEKFDEPYRFLISFSTSF